MNERYALDFSDKGDIFDFGTSYFFCLLKECLSHPFFDSKNRNEIIEPIRETINQLKEQGNESERSKASQILKFLLIDDYDEIWHSIDKYLASKENEGISKLPPAQALVAKHLQDALPLNKLFSLRQSQTPQPVESSLDDLSVKKIKGIADAKLWFSRYDKLNDPFEFATLSSFIGDASAHGRLRRKAEFLQKAIKICSFSGRCDNVAMWSYYANEGKGFCGRYSVSRWSQRFLRPVIYKKEQSILSSVLRKGSPSLFGFDSCFFPLQFFHHYPFCLADPDSPYFEEGPLDEVFSNEDEYFLENVIAMVSEKGDDWAHEEEIRLFYPSCPALEGNSVKETDLGVSLGEIICGPNSSNASDAFMKNQFASRQNVKTTKLTLSKDKYSFVRKAI